MAIQGNLKKTARDPDSQNQAYTKFSTEMPVFANQQQLYQQLTRTGTEIKAEPVSDGRGFFGNLLLSLLPVLLLAGLWIWLDAARGRRDGRGGLGEVWAASVVSAGRNRPRRWRRARSGSTSTTSRASTR